MAIKRVTIEIDDMPDMARATAPPSSLVRKKQSLPAEKHETSPPEEQDDYSEREAVEKEQNVVRGAESIGRTPSDLVYTFINRPEFMPTALTFLAFLIFVSKLQQLDDFWLPIGAAFVLNGVWFSIVLIRRVAIWLRKK
jgi:hypothetical protein